MASPPVIGQRLAGLVYYGKPVGKELHAKIDGRWRGSRKNGEYAKCMEAILKVLSAPWHTNSRQRIIKYQRGTTSTARAGLVGNRAWMARYAPLATGARIGLSPVPKL